MSVYDVAAVDRLNRLRPGNPGQRLGEVADMSSPSSRMRRTKSNLDKAKGRPFQNSLPTSPRVDKANSLRQSMDRHKASLSRPDSPQSPSNDDTQSLHGDDVRRNNDDETRSLYSDDIQRLRNDDTRSLHSDDIQRMHNDNSRRLHNDDIPRLRYNQRLQQPSHHRQTSLNIEESNDRYHRRADQPSGYRTVSSTRPRSSVMESHRSDSFQETKRSLRNSQIYMDEVDFHERPRSQQYRDYSVGLQDDRQDEFFDLDAHRYPRLSNNYTTLPNNMRLHGSNQRCVESFRESQENLRESQENFYDESCENPAYGSRDNPPNRFPISSNKGESITSSEAMIRESENILESLQDRRTPPSSHHSIRRSHTPHLHKPNIESYESSSRRPHQDYYESERNCQSSFSPSPRSARTSQRNSPNRQSDPRYNGPGSGYRSSAGPSPSSSNRSSRACSPISRRSSRNVSPVHSIHSSRPVSPASSVHSYRERTRPTNLPFDPPSHIKRQYTPSRSQTSSARSSRATSPCHSHCSSKSKVRESDWRAESVQPKSGNQNISSQIEQYLLSTGQESDSANGAPAVIYVRETFKIINQGDQGFGQLSHNGNHNQGQPPSPSIFPQGDSHPHQQSSQKPISNMFASPLPTNGSRVGTGLQEEFVVDDKQWFKSEESSSKDVHNQITANNLGQKNNIITQHETNQISSIASNTHKGKERNSSTPVDWKKIEEQKHPFTNESKRPTFEPNKTCTGDYKEEFIREDIIGKSKEDNTSTLLVQNNDWIDKDSFWCNADQLLGVTDSSDVKSAGEPAVKEFEPLKNSEKPGNNLGDNTKMFIEREDVFHSTNIPSHGFQNNRITIDKSIGADIREPTMSHIEEDCRSSVTQDSFTSTTLDKKVTVHLTVDDLKSANVSITDRSSLERLLDSLSVRVQQIEEEHGDKVADLADLDDSARAESVTSLLSSASSKGKLDQQHHNQEASGGTPEVETHSTIRRQSVIIEGLTMETDELRRKCLILEDELGNQGDATPMVEDLNKKLHKVETKLEDSESYCYQVVEENVELKTEMEALEAEISEVQDTFRDKDAKEFKKVKWELENLSKTCRNLQIKLGKAQAKATRLRQEKEEIEDHQREQMVWKTTAVVAAAALATFHLLRQFK